MLMTNKQKEIYIHLLENRVDDLEKQVSEMKAELLKLSHLIIQYKIPTLDPLPYPFQSD